MNTRFYFGWTALVATVLLWAAFMLAGLAVEAWATKNAEAEKANAEAVTEQVEIKPSSVPEITPTSVHTLASAMPAPSPAPTVLPAESTVPVEVVPLESAGPGPTEDLPETMLRYGYAWD